MNIQQAKQRFKIIGNSPLLDRSIDIAIQVAPTDLSVLITGESGTGKEVMPQIIHENSPRKHSQYIAVNCGAIPEGTIDSELFGHEKGAFTGASDSRKGYFEVADGGTIFLDEVGELPMETQARLLRVLETGEFIKVGSSQVKKTNIRLIAATNVNISEAIKKHRFREDLYYRLNTVPIRMPALRERKEDIYLLFRKFASDFADRYNMPVIRLENEAQIILENYRWPGNVRQLKNITEQISIIEKERHIDVALLTTYLPLSDSSSTPVFLGGSKEQDFTEREILYKVLFDMKRDISDLKKIVYQLAENGQIGQDQEEIVQRFYRDENAVQPSRFLPMQSGESREAIGALNTIVEANHHLEIEETLSLADTEKELIKKALEKYRGRRKNAAKELGISERTLYRKIKEYNING